MIDAVLILTEYLLFASCLFILAGSIFITIKTRFIQIRLIPMLFGMLRASLQSREEQGKFTIKPHRALFTAMSTTLGIGTIVGPVIAISLGGPGALIGFLLTSFFGAAATFSEVSLCIQHRKKQEDGVIMGGPMQYLKHIFSPAVAKWYAICCFVLMTAWSGAQANQLAAILDSPLLGEYRISTMISGALIALLVLGTLMGGIKRVSSFSAKLVPVMFVTYLSASLWILFANLDKLWGVWTLIFQSAFSPYELGTGVVIGGIVSSLRWGVFKGTQASEAGVGTQTIPHSMAETNDPVSQGALAMLSTYTAGVISFISGSVALITETWLDPSLPLGISMVAASFQMYFSYMGIIIVSISALLFAFGTILGNSFNGCQCFGYLTSNKGFIYYYLAMGTVIFLGSIGEAKLVWSLVDLVLVGIALPHMAALVLHTHRSSRSVSQDVQLVEIN